MMTNGRKNNRRENRVDALKAAGINTSKYFSIELPKGLKPGAKINITIDENGAPVMTTPNFEMDIQSKLTKEEKELFNKVYDDGYVNNSKLHRRWVMAQMFRMLNYESYDGKCGYNAYLNDHYDYMYQFDMMLNEIWVLSKLEEKDREEFEKRTRFFNEKVVYSTCEDYLGKLLKYIEKQPVKHCKGIPYKRVSGKNIFTTDIYQKVTSNVEIVLSNVLYVSKRISTNSGCASYKDLYCSLHAFVYMANKWKLPKDTSKCKAWMNAYKGAGSYYTLLNMVKFHECGVHDGRIMLYGMNAVDFIEARTNEYDKREEYYRLFALLKKTIKDNDFNFGLRMKEIYGNR